jgi:hypothetical protein
MQTSVQSDKPKQLFLNLEEAIIYALTITIPPSMQVVTLKPAKQKKENYSTLNTTN